MTILPFLITAFVFVVLIASGVVLNMYMYSKGAFRVRRLRTVPMNQQAVAEDLLPMSLGIPDMEMGDYVRRGVTIFVGTVAALTILVVMILSSMR